MHDRYSQPSAGSTLLLVIAALVILSAVGAGIATLTPSTSETTLGQNKQQQAYYAALSGLNFAGSLTAAALEAIHDGSASGAYTMGDTAFSLAVSAQNPDGTYPVAVLGSAGSGVGHYYISAQNVTPASSGPAETWTGGNYVVNAGNTTLTLPQSAAIPGDVAGAGVTLSQYASVTGKVVSSKGVSVGQYGTVGGSLCAQNGDVMLHQRATVDGDVSAIGNITLGQYAKANANAYATKNISMNQYARIALVGQAGGSISRAQYDSIGTPIEYLSPTVTCDDSTAPKAPAITCPATSHIPASSATNPLAPGDYKNWTTPQNGTAYLKSGTYTFSSIQFNQYMDLYLDVSSGNPLTILSCDTVTTGQYTRVHIKTTTNGTYQRVSNATPHSDAALIYLGSDSDILFNQYSEWFGTAYSKTNLTVGQYFTLVGTLASLGGMSISDQLTVIEFVLADYAKQHWTKN